MAMKPFNNLLAPSVVDCWMFVFWSGLLLNDIVPLYASLGGGKQCVLTLGKRSLYT